MSFFWGDEKVPERQDHLLCSNCGGKLTLLFTSGVCDRCDPPNGVEPLEWWEEFSVRPVEHFPWITNTTAARHFEQARYVVMFRMKDVTDGVFGDALFAKYTTNTLGSYTLDFRKRVSNDCLKWLYAWSWDRGNTYLQQYFYRYDSRYDRVVYLRWKG